MPEDLYGDGPDQTAAANSEETTQKERDEETQGKTAVINSEICPGMKPGDEMVLRIVAVNEGEYTVEYAPSKEEPEQAGEPAEAPMGGGGEGSMYE